MVRSSMLLALIALAVLIASFISLVQAEGGFARLPKLLQRGADSMGLPVNIEALFDSDASHQDARDDIWPREYPTPPEFVSGDSRFSHGTCTNDIDCVPAGCSGEVCSSDRRVVSTCEFSESFPNVQGYTCGCVQGVCGWR